jgi:hypothetical protein
MGNINIRAALDYVNTFKDAEGKYIERQPPVVPPEVRKPYSSINDQGDTVQDMLTQAEREAKGTTTTHKFVAPEGRRPEKPGRHFSTWKDDDPESDTFGQSFRIVEDDNGNVISKKRITGAVPAATAPGPPTKAGNAKDPLGIR